MLGNPATSRRKSEAAANAGDDFTPHHHKGGGGQNSLIETPPPMSDLWKSRAGSEENERDEMCILPTFSQKRVFEDWIFDTDCRFGKFDSAPLSELLDKMNDMLGNSAENKDREAGGLRDLTK